MNTSESIQNERAGKQWDQRTRKWIDKSDGTIVEDSPELEEARRQHNRTAGAGASSSRRAATKSTAPTAFPYYYTVLGVDVRTLALSVPLPVGTKRARCKHPLPWPCCAIMQESAPTPAHRDREYSGTSGSE